MEYQEEAVTQCASARAGRAERMKKSSPSTRQAPNRALPAFFRIPELTFPLVQAQQKILQNFIASFTVVKERGC